MPRPHCFLAGTLHSNRRAARMALACMMFALFAAAEGKAQSETLPATVNVTLDTKHPGGEISEQFSGLSYETSAVLPGRDGKYLFSAQNAPLIATFKQLGIKNLRIGGNAADRATVKIPVNADLDQLFAFAKAADVKVIYTFRLKEGDPKAAAETAKYLMDHYKDRITAFMVGNEPNMYLKEFDPYRDEVKKFMGAITAPDAAPDAKFTGASATPGKKAWAADFAKAFAGDKRIALITQHAYFGGAAGRMATPQAARDKLLSADMPTSYTKFYQSFMPEVEAQGLACRFEEANSYYNGGAKGASDAYAAALWSLDYMHWSAAYGGVEGFNFHMAGKTYTAFTPAGGGYSVQPLGYGMKAFDLGGHGKIVPARVESKDDNPNLTAYAVTVRDAIIVTVINKEHDAGARDALVTIDAGDENAQAQLMLLTAPDGDVAATSGITLGGAAMETDGTWDGKWSAMPEAVNGKFELKLPAASAAVIRLGSR